MADGITITAGAAATPPDQTKVATDDAGAAGHVQLFKLAVSADGSAVLVPADASGLRVATQPRADAPQTQRLTSPNLSAGANVDLTANDITSGKTGRLAGADVGASVCLRIDIQTIDGARTTRTTVFTGPGRTREWRPPGPTYITQAGGAGKAFGASVTNLDPTEVADIFVVLYWDEV